MRQELALAMALDTTQAALRARRVTRVIVITPDPHVSTALANAGAEVFVQPPTVTGLNQSLMAAIHKLHGLNPFGVLLADLPALRSKDIDQAMDEAAGRYAMCTDRDGTGTTLLLSDTAGQITPQFGPCSATHHRRTGAVPLIQTLSSLRHDVDTLPDLMSATQLGIGYHTAAWTRRATREYAHRQQADGVAIRESEPT
jgi:2-phospho-L-lactate guanylyltransferase